MSHVLFDQISCQRRCSSAEHIPAQVELCKNLSRPSPDCAAGLTWFQVLVPTSISPHIQGLFAPVQLVPSPMPSPLHSCPFVPRHHENLLTKFASSLVNAAG
jgi:hypothetical protein